MKLLVILLLISVVKASPLGEHQRWNMIPDEDGKLHVIDVNPIEDVVEPAFNPEADTRFVLFTRNNPTSGQQLFLSIDSIRNSNFDPSAPVRVLIHGWNSGLTSGVNTRPTESYLQLGTPFNVIQVDWSVGAGTVNYISARNRVPSVAAVIANFLNFLVDNNIIASMEQVSIAGHSLGAHIAGITGKRTQESGRFINTIWGLDPAGPLFNMNNPNDRMDANDAIYTEGIRTNIGGSGFAEPFCHADFYPNGGDNQPGCGLDLTGSCSHSRAHALFADSILNDGFVAVRCESFNDARTQRCTGQREASMGGEPGNTGLRGIFHLRTSNASPFALG
ncbi:hypothetical protein PVAND_012550 [Polypedilum vanderplanki]|uniref:Lipase domain-containing protein n=1 Tax=Polypedilum vanderplanki TaxID=319348 RepID=A0A9J6CLV1_POLVA|nr:hypothetical protein PVAND_012550 [Polypedilum vanderplanki]